MDAAYCAARVEQTLEKLTLDEKIHLLHGNFKSGGVERLNIPPLMCADGPLGVRMKSLQNTDQPGGSNAPGSANAEVTDTGLEAAEQHKTAMPSTLGLAATFNFDTAGKYAEIIAREAEQAGIHVMFGPGVNLMRDPRCGRNFEYFGEDPILTSNMGCAYIQAMQKCGIGACAKHYYANDIEHLRHQTSSNLDKRTAWEVHLRPFVDACTQAHTWTIMTGNNLVNGTHISENAEQLRQVLRDRLGWDGVVLTDWRAAYTPAGCASGGTDMTTGLCSYVYGDEDLPALIAAGKVTEDQIDQQVRHILGLYIKTGQLPCTPQREKDTPIENHADIAREIAAESIVLLKNSDQTLPLEPEKTKRLLICGPAAKTVQSGSGSSAVEDSDAIINPLDGLKNIYQDTELLLCENIDDCPELQNIDAVIYFADAPRCGEGFDISTIKLDHAQQKEIIALGKSGKKLVVAMQCGTAVDVSGWIDSVSSLLVCWYGGEQLGNAIADVLSGKVSPSAKLPCTFARLEQYPCAMQETWPPKKASNEPLPEVGFTKVQRKPVHGFNADYTEGRLIGYRWFQKHNIAPQFPFGFGLSYTNFEISDPKVTVEDSRIRFSCKIKNTGNVHGAEIIQIYTSSPETLPDTPVREFKGHIRCSLAPGENASINALFEPEIMTRYCEKKGELTYIPGRYKIEAGTSSEDIFFSSHIDLDFENMDTVSVIS